MDSPHSVKKVVLFDGVCNLCSASVLFILNHNPKKNIQFASLQSDYGQQQLAHYKIAERNSVVYIKGQNYFTQSDAVLEICRELNGLYPILYVWIVLPKFFRDWVYNFVANHRYKWFGKRKTCWVPTPELTSRFLGLI